jgi:hypothetical protein
VYKQVQCNKSAIELLIVRGKSFGCGIDMLYIHLLSCNLFFRILAVSYWFYALQNKKSVICSMGNTNRIIHCYPLSH